MNTVRYIVCGALSGYCIVAYGLIWLPLPEVIFSVLVPVSLIGGGCYGYRHARNKRARNNGVVRALPERIQGSTHATAA
jgi:hypothetical protein